jgi:isochorismate synthase
VSALATELFRQTPDVIDPSGLFVEGLRRARIESGISVITIPVPSADPTRLLALAGFDTSILWSSPGESEVCGLGESARIDASGKDRFSVVRDRARALYERVFVSGGAPAPRLYGGFAFAPGACGESPWTDFGDAIFSLPRWTYRRGSSGASLSFAIDASSLDGASEAEALDELEAIGAALAEPATGSSTTSSVHPIVRAVVHQDSAEFEAKVREIVEAIRAGRFEKIVAARRSEVFLGEEIEPATIARRLARRFGGCTTFAFRRGDSTFVGATPERLLSLRGRVVRTEALAGTAPTSDPDAERKLRASGKDLEEHLLVVREVERRLAPISSDIEHPERPAVRRLPNVLHLETPITARLDSDLHALDVASILHPTPAVGGIPRGDALDWIVRNENAARGWYSGPVGWIDERGDGALSVALRSGLLARDRAYLWAGGGIVRDSQPAAEYEEAAVKLSALLDALTGGGAA